MPVYLLATLDTKGIEAEFVKARLAEIQIPCLLVDTGCLGSPSVKADITREEVFSAAGTSLAEMQSKGDRGEAVRQAAAGAAYLVMKAYQEGKVQGVLGLGGSAGTSIATAAMRQLPLGLPKLMVSTLASGDVKAFVGPKDICMLNPVVDISGINRISRIVLSEAAAAMAGMIQFQFATEPDPASSLGLTKDRPLVAASMFGVTTPCVEHARSILEAAGYEVLVFHATGTGGEAMEALVRDGLIAGVLDITTTELADQLVGGVLTAGPSRLTAAAERGVPQVVSVGATDMVNFWAMETVPSQFRERKLYKHNENVTLMRTTAEECIQIGREIGGKVAASTAPALILFPRQGVSAIDKSGQPFDDPLARAALLNAITTSAGKVPVEELDLHINDPAFAETAANKLIELMKRNNH